MKPGPPPNTRATVTLGIELPPGVLAHARQAADECEIPLAALDRRGRRSVSRRPDLFAPGAPGRRRSGADRVPPLGTRIRYTCYARHPGPDATVGDPPHAEVMVGGQGCGGRAQGQRRGVRGSTSARESGGDGFGTMADRQRDAGRGAHGRPTEVGAAAGRDRIGRGAQTASFPARGPSAIRPCSEAARVLANSGSCAANRSLPASASSHRPRRPNRRRTSGWEAGKGGN
jgi:hypothetical protein